MLSLWEVWVWCVCRRWAGGGGGGGWALGGGGVVVYFHAGYVSMIDAPSGDL